jgi:hypothetical protein
MGMSKLRYVKGLFSGRHFDREVILLCVRWYLRYKLSLRDLVEMTAERKLELAHTAIMRCSNSTCRSLKELGLLCTQSRPILACRRDVSEGARTAGLSVPCRGQDWQYRGFPSQSEA